MKNLLYILGLIFGAFLVSLFWRRCADNTEVVSDTIFKVIKVDRPIVRESTVVKYKVVRLPIAKDTICVSSRKCICVSDTIKDSVFVQIPIEQKVYSDSNYTAWVSGYNPKLDSISITHTEVSHKLVNNSKGSKRLFIGIQVGYGITPRGMQPYLGLGVSYNFFGF